MMIGLRKPLFWIGSTKRDLKTFPDEVQDMMGHALDIAQQGKKHQDAKPLAGFGSAGVLEIIEDYAGDTYRYALHAFQKKSKKGIETPKQEIDLIRSRLKKAEAHYAEWSQKKE